jgi:hypothetical protein
MEEAQRAPIKASAALHTPKAELPSTPEVTEAEGSDYFGKGAHLQKAKQSNSVHNSQDVTTQDPNSGRRPSIGVLKIHGQHSGHQSGHHPSVVFSETNISNRQDSQDDDAE